MRSLPTPSGRHILTGLVAAALFVLLIPLSASAHSELKSSDPAEGASVPSPFGGPVVLTFSEHLADGSKADLVGPDGSTIVPAIIDAAAPTMTFTLASPLAPGTYQVKWVSIADDGDLLRGTLSFSVVAEAVSASPEATNPPGAPSPEPTNPPGAASTVEAATPPASPATSGGSSSGSGGDVILPIVIALIVAAAGAFYLVRRNRPA